MMMGSRRPLTGLFSWGGFLSFLSFQNKQSKYRTSRGIEYRENARSAPMASIEIYELSREGQTHVEISFNSIIGYFNLHIGSTS